MRKLLLTLFTLLLWQSTYALIVSVKGEGEIPEEGLDLTLTEGETDILTGEYMMSITGELLTADPLTVVITRSESGLTDEFCCGVKCTAGNGLTQETQTFEVTGLNNWYVHYRPAPNTDVTVTYRFSDGTDSRELRVHYIYALDALTDTHAPCPCTKILRDGNLLIQHEGSMYYPTGVEVR